MIKRLKFIVILVIIGLLGLAYYYRDQGSMNTAQTADEVELFLARMIQTTEERIPKLKEEVDQLVADIIANMKQAESSDPTAEGETVIAKDEIQAVETEQSENNDLSSLDRKAFEEGYKLIQGRLENMDSEELMQKLKQHYQLLRSEMSGSEPEPPETENQ